MISVLREVCVKYYFLQSLQARFVARLSGAEVLGLQQLLLRRVCYHDLSHQHKKIAQRVLLI